MAKREQKSAEEIEDDDRRTNSMGLFNYAEAYLEAAGLLQAKLKQGHSQSPVRFLYHHAMVLYLKSLLRQRYDLEKLAKKFGHDLKRMSKKAMQLGAAFVAGFFASCGALTQ